MFESSIDLLLTERLSKLQCSYRTEYRAVLFKSKIDPLSPCQMNNNPGCTRLMSPA